MAEAIFDQLVLERAAATLPASAIDDLTDMLARSSCEDERAAKMHANLDAQNGTGETARRLASDLRAHVPRQVHLHRSHARARTVT